MLCLSLSPFYSQELGCHSTGTDGEATADTRPGLLKYVSEGSGPTPSTSLVAACRQTSEEDDDEEEV